MSHFSTALAEIITRSFENNASSLARKTSMSPSTISRLLTGKFEPAMENLENLANALARSDRKQLLIAAARDRVPSQFQDEIFGDEDPASQILRAKLSPDLAAVIRYLESNAMNDELTAAYLRRIAQWIFSEPQAAAPAPRASVTYPSKWSEVSKVAEDEPEYKITKKTGEAGSGK